MTDKTPDPCGSDSSTEFGHLEKLMREFEEWAYVRDFDTTRSFREPHRYSNERTQGAWQAWGHGTSNWRDNRDIAVRLLRECERTLAMLAGVAPVVSLLDELRKVLGLEQNTTNKEFEASNATVRIKTRIDPETGALLRA